METVFKKYFWILQGLGVIVVALLLSSAVNSFLGSVLVKYTVAIPATDDESVVAVAQEQQYAPELDLRLGPQPAEADEPVDPCASVTCEDGEVCDPTTATCVPDANAEQTEDEETFDDARCLESDIAINLVGTMVATDDEWSVAVLHNPATDKTEFASVGDTILAQAEVLSIERSRVMLRRNGVEECLRPGEQTERAERRQAQGGATETEEPERNNRSNRNNRDDEEEDTTASASPTPSRPATLEERIEAGVQRERNGQYSIDRSILEEVTENSAVLQAQAPDVQQYYENGRSVGFRLSGIRGGSMFSAIGIRNGDIIRSVNGQPVNSPQRAMELYETMLNESSVRIVVQRRGRDVTLNYNIQ